MDLNTDFDNGIGNHAGIKAANVSSPLTSVSRRLLRPIITYTIDDGIVYSLDTMEYNCTVAPLPSSIDVPRLIVLSLWGARNRAPIGLPTYHPSTLASI